VRQLKREETLLGKKKFILLEEKGGKARKRKLLSAGEKRGPAQSEIGKGTGGEGEMFSSPQGREKIALKKKRGVAQSHLDKRRGVFIKGGGQWKGRGGKGGVCSENMPEGEGS